MLQLLDTLKIPGITALVGFFWFLAYKHPRTYRVIAAPIVGISVIGLIGSISWLLAWETYSMETESFADIWNEFDKVERISEVQEAVNSKVNSIGRYGIPIAVGFGCCLTLLVFFSFVSKLIAFEKNNESQSEEENNNTESKSRNDSI